MRMVLQVACLMALSAGCNSVGTGNKDDVVEKEETESLKPFSVTGFLSKESKSPPALQDTLLPQQMLAFVPRILLFQHPFFEPLEQQYYDSNIEEQLILPSGSCPSKFWDGATTELHNQNVVTVEHATQYDCLTPSDATDIHGTETSATVKGQVFYAVHCPNYDLASISNKPVAGLQESSPRAQICNDAAKKREFLQIEVQIDWVTRYTLEGKNIEIFESNQSVLMIDDPKSDFCEVIKDGETYRQKSCQVTILHKVLNFKKTENGAVIANKVGFDQNPGGILRIAFPDITYTRSGRWYRTGTVEFQRNGWSGTVSYQGENEPLWEATDGNVKIGGTISADTIFD